MLEPVRTFFLAHYDAFKDFASPTVGLIGVVLTGILAWRGLNSFERWRNEKIEERRIQVAIDALAIAHEATIVFAAVMARGVSNDEYAEMSDGANPSTQGVYRSAQTGPYVVLKRLRLHDEFFERAGKLEPQYAATFDAGDEFARLFEARRSLEVIATVLFDDCRIELDPEDREGRTRRKE